MTDTADADTRVVLSFPLGEPESLTLTRDAFNTIKMLEELALSDILRKSDLRPCTRHEVIVSVKMERTSSGGLCVSDVPVIEAIVRSDGVKMASFIQSQERPHDAKRAYRIYSFFEGTFQSAVEIPANV